MGYERLYDTISIPVAVTVHEFVCDAMGCNTYLRLVTSDEDYDRLIQATMNTRLDLDPPDDGTYIRTEDDARTVAVEHYQWQEGTVGVQRDHLYCPRHSTRSRED
ncbi:hypothetical protein [Bifidobacterium tissieri]|uniref:Uncharacterized protein n=1 Tax=Bifidobacterium tissieri TaxID=1630162 RepID=A0A5M9ZVF9_9BIFI|nr:hypothetical protein [Bifidobacterium tissieri]KAA8828661.1 hypothetical protein EM849_11530 [Bifidobacterium tissieri]KAA8831604.1 hypothetical protein EMO89_02445 [Bifidobacterium tissieri]